MISITNSFQGDGFELDFPFPIHAVRSFTIDRTFNTHTTCILALVMSEEDAQLLMEKGSFIHTIQIRHNYNGKTQYWFSGGIATVDVDMEDGISHVKVTGISRSHQMDVEQRSRSFQNKQTTYTSLIGQLAKPYPQGAARNEATHPNAVIGELVVQYQETDWQFMKRLASRVGTMILPDITMDAPRIYFGVPDFTWGGKIDAYYYRYVNDHAKYMDYAAHTEDGVGSVNPTDVAHYEVRSNEYHEVGSNVTFKGKSWVVTGAQISYEQGLLSYQHVLVDRSALQRKSKLNHRIQGVALEGKVIRRANNMVQVHLDIDGAYDEQSNWWFPYSPEGNNMVHAMPEEGARIKVYFPDGKEKKAMAVNSSRGKHEEMKGRTVFQKPSTKVFHMPGAAKMELGEDGVLFEKNTVRMRLDQANILVESDHVLYIRAENTMEMGNSEAMSKRIRMLAEENIEFRTVSGQSAMKIWGNQVGIQSDQVDFHKVEMSLLDMLNEEDLKEMYIDDEIENDLDEAYINRTKGMTQITVRTNRERQMVRERVTERVRNETNVGSKAYKQLGALPAEKLVERHQEYVIRKRTKQMEEAQSQTGTAAQTAGAVGAGASGTGKSQGSYISNAVNQAGNYLGKLMDMSEAGVQGKSGLENLAGAILNDLQFQMETSGKPDYYTKEISESKYYARYTFLQFKVAPEIFWSELQIAAGLLGLVLAPFTLGGSLTLTVLGFLDAGLSIANIVIASKKESDLREGKLETEPTFLGMNQSFVNIAGLITFAGTLFASVWKVANVGADARRVKALAELDRLEDTKRLEQAAIRKRVEGNVAESKAVREARQEAVTRAEKKRLKELEDSKKIKDEEAKAKNKREETPEKRKRREEEERQRRREEEERRRREEEERKRKEEAEGMGEAPPRVPYSKEVEIADKQGNPLGEFDEIDLVNKIFHEDKSAEGLSVINPKTGKPFQTAEKWANKQIYAKTKERILNLQKVDHTRPTKNGSVEIPTLDEIKDVRRFNFRMNADTPELREAVQKVIEKLKEEFPDYTFTAEFGKGGS